MVKYSTESKAYPSTEERDVPSIGKMLAFPAIIGAIGGITGAIAHFSNAESALSSAVGKLTSVPAGNALFLAGAASMIAAYGACVSIGGGARKAYGVPHPKQAVDGKEEDQVAFLNGQRGFQNMVESFPFYLLNFYLCREVGQAPCLAGASMVVYGIARIWYARSYATQGPEGRGPGFILAAVMSTLCFGYPLVKTLLE